VAKVREADQRWERAARSPVNPEDYLRNVAPALEALKLADVVFTSGYSLYEAKRRLHHNIHPFPSGPFPSGVDLDETLASSAWDDAWARMMNLINLTFKNRYSEDCGLRI